MEYMMILGYVACCVASGFVLADDYRKLWDIKTPDAIFIIAFSLLGPLSLVAAIVVWAIGRGVDGSISGEYKTWWRKK